MKNKFIVSVMLSLFVMICVAALGCSSPAAPEAEEAEAAVAFDSPTFQPADHEGRFESNGADACSGCHAGEATAGGPSIPDTHYVDGSADSGEIDNVRKQCITCHPVSE